MYIYYSLLLGIKSTWYCGTAMCLLSVNVANVGFLGILVYKKTFLLLLRFCNDMSMLLYLQLFYNTGRNVKYRLISPPFVCQLI